MQSFHPGKTVILFDGNCNFCTRWILFLIKIDRHDRFRFSASSLPAAATYVDAFNLSQFLDESVILIREDQVYIKSDAVLMILHTLGGGWKLLDFWSILPHSWTDGIYDWLSSKRYKLFGRRDECMVPDETLKRKFIGY